MLADLQDQFSHAISASCLLCLLHSHAGSEELKIFPAMATVDPALVRSLIDDHTQISLRLASIAKLSAALVVQDSAPARLALGVRLNQEANEFFAFYLAHMNREETTIVPAMKEQFTDAQMGAMQGAVIAALPPDQLKGYLRWMLPSMNLAESTTLVGDVQRGAPPPLLDLLKAVAEATVDPARWALVRERVGI